MVVDAFFEGRFVEAVEAAEVFDKFLSGEPAIESGGCGEKTDIGADFFGVLDDIVATDDGGAVGGLENGGEHAESGSFASAICAQEAVDFAWLTLKADVVDGADFTALFVLEAFGQATSINHGWTPRLDKAKDRATGFTVYYGRAERK